MKLSRLNRRVRSAVNNTVESLEKRQLLSATLISNVPAQTITGGGSATINLATYLNDPQVTSGTLVVMQTPLGAIPLQLDNAKTPNTVANFLKYINNGDYAPTLIQRLAAGFVIQGGGDKPNGSTNASLGKIGSEAGISNTTGTIAMALSTGPNSGSDEWFINLANNNGTGSTPDLDNTADGGPFTAFGNVIDSGMTVVNAIASLSTIDGSAENGEWSDLPVINYTGSSTPTTVPQANLVTDNMAISTGITYSALSADPSVVTASVSAGGDALTLTPAAGATAGMTTTVTATVTDLSGNTQQSTFNVTIAAAPTPAVSITNASGTIGTNSQIAFPVTLSVAGNSAVTFDYTLTPGTASTADYSATGSSLTIPAGSTTATIPVNILGDSLGATETFTITLTNLSTGATFTGGAASETATGTINPLPGTLVPTTTTLQATNAAVPAGNADTFVATVTPKVTGTAPTGTVVFSINGISIGTAGITGGTATLTTLLSTPGNQPVTATYSGSSTYSGSTSNTVNVNVATLAPTISRSTLPGTIISGVAAHGTVFVTAVDDIATPMKKNATFDIFASTDGFVDSSSILVGTYKKSINLVQNGQTTAPVAVGPLLTKLSAGSYTLIAQTLDPLGNTSDSPAGIALTVQTAVVALSESFTRFALPTSVLAGAKTPLAALLKITNSGNVRSTGPMTITLYASTDGTIADGTAFKTITSKAPIAAGGSIPVSVPLTAYPNVADGNYDILVQVTDPRLNTSSAEYSAPVNIAAAKIDLANTVAAVPTNAKIGKTLLVTLDVANNGNVTASGTIDIAFSISATSDGSNSVSLATVSTHVTVVPDRVQVLHLHVPIPAGIAPGSFYLVSNVDSTNKFNDIDLLNNTGISATAITLS